MAVAICSACATGKCSACTGRVHVKRATAPCACRHGAEPPAGGRTLQPTDPRRAGGAILDPGAGGDVLVDTRRAVWVEESHVCRMENPSDGRELMAALLDGRLNRSDERVAVLYLLGPDGAAALVSELVGLAARMGPAFELEFRQLLEARMDVTELWPTGAR